MKDKILKEFDEEYIEKIDKYNPLKEELKKLFTDQKQFLIKAIAQTREETIREIKEKLNKVIKHNSEISEDYQYAYGDLIDEINKLKK